MRISPFKLKKEYIENNEVLKLAQDIFGTPSEILATRWDYADDTFANGIPACTPGEKTVYYWRFYGNTSVCYLTISHKLNDEFVGIEIIENSFSEDNTISVNINEYVPDWKDKLKKLIKAIKKPWSDWEEKEIISSPMWIYYFFCENRIVPDHYRNAMVMFSYENPDNLWVKRYFDEQNKKESE